MPDRKSYSHERLSVRNRRLNVTDDPKLYHIVYSYAVNVTPPNYYPTDRRNGMDSITAYSEREARNAFITKLYREADPAMNLGHVEITKCEVID